MCFVYFEVKVWYKMYCCKKNSCFCLMLTLFRCPLLQKNVTENKHLLRDPEPVIIFGLRFAFITHISGKKTHSFKICALKKRNDFRQLKSNFRVEACITKENVSKILNTMAYKTVTSMRDCVI